MNSFKIVASPDKRYDFLIIAESYENPLDSFEEVRKGLNVSRAKLIFDLILINGVQRNRYIECVFNRASEVFSSCSVVDNVSESLRSESRNFFLENKHLIAASVLPKALKFLLCKGNV